MSAKGRVSAIRLGNGQVWRTDTVGNVYISLGRGPEFILERADVNDVIALLEESKRIARDTLRKS